MASVDVLDATGLIKRHHEFFRALHRSQDEALGAFVRRALEKHKGGTLNNAAAYPVPDSLVIDAAHYLTVEREQRNGG
jgi:hypothetical protein